MSRAPALNAQKYSSEIRERVGFLFSDESEVGNRDNAVCSARNKTLEATYVRSGGKQIPRAATKPARDDAPEDWGEFAKKIMTDDPVQRSRKSTRARATITKSAGLGSSPISTAKEEVIDDSQWISSAVEISRSTLHLSPQEATRQSELSIPSASEVDGAHVKVDEQQTSLEEEWGDWDEWGEPVENRLWEAGKRYRERVEAKRKDKLDQEGTGVKLIFQNSRSRAINRVNARTFLQRLENRERLKKERLLRQREQLEDKQRRLNPHKPTLEARREVKTRLVESTATWVTCRRTVLDVDAVRAQRDAAEAEEHCTFQPQCTQTPRAMGPRVPFHVRRDDYVEQWHRREHRAREYIEQYMVDETFQPKVCSMSQAMTPRGNAVFDELHTNNPRRVKPPFVPQTKQSVRVTNATFDILADIVNLGSRRKMVWWPPTKSANMEATTSPPSEG